MSSRAGSARAHSTISGTRAVTSLQLPREDAHLVAGPVDLHARAVELVLERRLAQRAPSASSASPAGLASIGATGEGGAARSAPSPAAPSASATRASSPDAGAYIAARRTSRARQARAPARPPPRRALERALAHLAHQQLDEETASRLVGRLEERVQEAEPALGRARAGLGGDRGERLVHAGQRGRLADRRPRRHAGSSVRQPTPMRPCRRVPVR